MSYLKYSFAAFAIALVTMPSMAQAQNFQQLGTRRGAVTGAILGAVIGDQNNEALAGAAIGGLVGGVIGNTSGRNLDRQFGGGQPIYGYGGNYGYGAPVYSRPAPAFYGGGFGPSVNIQYQRVAPVVPVYGGGGFHGGGFYHRPAYGGYGYGRPGCGGGW